MMGPLRTVRLVAAVATLVVALAGCTRSAGPDPDPGNDAQLQQQARDILFRWDATVAESPRKPAYAPTYDVEMLHDSAQILSGRPLVLDPRGPFEIPPTELRWPDGTTREASGLTATQAFARLVGYAGPSSRCRPCPATHVTAARVLTLSLDAVGGPVTVPAWEFTFAEFPDHAILPAIRPDEVLLPRPTTTDKGHESVGLVPDKALTDPTGRRLVVEFTGLLGDASTPCGADYTVEPVFSDRAIVVIIHEHRHDPPAPAIMCPQGGGLWEVAVTLPQPLGSRVLLDVRFGRRIPLIRSIQ